jgi:hypothetical protein
VHYTYRRGPGASTAVRGLPLQEGYRKVLAVR